jgi:dTMP kinase
MSTLEAANSAQSAQSAINGPFISFEGIDGAGKSTHIESLAQAFKDLGRQVLTTREPGGTELAEKIRQLVLNDPMDAMTEALLVFAARRDHIQNCIEPALAKGQVVLCDRFTDATFAYQGGGRSFDWAVLTQLEAWVQTRAPDLTLWFDLSPQIAAERLAGARVPDKFESQPVAFFEKVVAGYAQRERADPQRLVRVDALGERDTVWARVLKTVQSRGFL